MQMNFHILEKYGAVYAWIVTIHFNVFNRNSWCMHEANPNITMTSSLVPRPKEAEEEKGPGFSHFVHALIAVEFHHLLRHVRQHMT